MTGPWPWVAGVALLQAALGVALWMDARREHTVYVLSPMPTVLPGAAPVDAVEAEALFDAARHRVDARDMQRAYARLGSTLSVDDLARGVEALETGPHPLTPAQREAARAILETATADRRALLATQAKILDLEAELDRVVAEVQPLLPPGTP